MALPPTPSLHAFYGVATGVPIFALLVTVWRLYYRVKRKLAWWDDLLVGLAALWMSLLVTFIWILNSPNLPQMVKIASYYMCTYTFTLANYFARLSILVGILRIAPNPQIRNILKGAAGFFVAIMCVLLAQKLWVCEGNSEMAKTWKTARDPSCHLGLQVALTELVTDIVSDSFLVITPLTFLSGARLKASQKRRLYAIFGASVATTVTSIVQDYLILAAGGLREQTASMMEVSVAIIVANVPVIVSCIYRLKRKREGDRRNSHFATDYDHSRRARPGAMAQATGDLISSSDFSSRGQYSTNLTTTQLGDTHPNISISHTDDFAEERKANNDLDAEVKSIVPFDDQAAKSIKIRDLHPQRSYDSTGDAASDDSVVIDVSAPPRGRDRPPFSRRTKHDDNITEMDKHHDFDYQLSDMGIAAATTTLDSMLMYQLEPHDDVYPVAQESTPISSEFHGTSRTDFFSNRREDAVPFPAMNSTSAVHGVTITFPSPPPVAVGAPQQQQIQTDRASPMKRSRSFARQLVRAATSPSLPGEQLQQQRQYHQRQRSEFSSRSHSPLSRFGTPGPGTTTTTTTTTTTGGGGGGLFGGNDGVLIQQQVHVVTDPEDVPQATERLDLDKEPKSANQHISLPPFIQ